VFSNLEEEQTQMNRNRIGDRPHDLGRAGIRLFQGASLALILVLAMPAGAVEERAVKSRVAPAYPEIAKRMRIGGAVKLEANVDAQGQVTDVKAVSGNHMLAVAAEDAIRKWKFAPGSGDSIVSVEVNFTVSQ
jgi:TonB family protein